MTPPRLPAGSLALLPPAAPAAPVVLDATTTLIVGADEPGPVMEAARDLTADFEKVIGRRPRIVQRREEASGPAGGIAGGKAGAPGAFSLAAPGGAGRPTGARLRGTVYAVLPV